MRQEENKWNQGEGEGREWEQKALGDREEEIRGRNGGEKRVRRGKKRWGTNEEQAEAHGDRMFSEIGFLRIGSLSCGVNGNHSMNVSKCVFQIAHFS